MKLNKIQPELLGALRTPNTQKQKNRPSIGVALGGGGIRGFANIGVLKALQQMDIVPDCLAGTSMGGIIAALYAKGVPPAEMEAEVLRLAKLPAMMKLVDWIPGRRGLMKGQNIYNYLVKLLGADLTFEELRVSVALTAVDLIHREEVVLCSGHVVDAIRASMAVPGIFEPAELGSRRLVDGGVLNNVPADVVRQLGADVVIAVDVGVGAAYDERSDANTPYKTPFPGFMPAIALDLWQAQSIMVDALTTQKLREAQPEITLRPAIPIEVGLFTGINLIESVIQAGEEVVEDTYLSIQALCQ